MKSKIWILLALLLCSSCSNNGNSSNNKKLYQCTGSFDGSFEYSIGLGETVYFNGTGLNDEDYCFLNNISLADYENKMENGTFTENPNFNPTIYNENEYEHIVIKENEYGFSIYCSEAFNEDILIDKITFTSGDYIYEMPCNVKLKYNDKYLYTQRLISNYTSIDQTFDTSSQYGICVYVPSELEREKNKNLKDSYYILGIPPLAKIGVAQNIIIKNIYSEYDYVKISDVTCLVSDIKNYTFSASSLVREEGLGEKITYPYKIETTKSVYTYLNFNVECKNESLEFYGFDVMLDYSINGDNYLEYVHIIGSNS